MSMKKIAGFAIPFLFQHLICCGALLFFLASSGYLLILRQEGDKKMFLLPSLAISAVLIFLYRYYGMCCERKGHKSLVDRVVLIFLYLIFSFLLGLIFMIYVFIPWWIPTYKGGLLLP